MKAIDHLRFIAIAISTTMFMAAFTELNERPTDLDGGARYDFKKDGYKVLDTGNYRYVGTDSIEATENFKVMRHDSIFNVAAVKGIVHVRGGHLRRAKERASVTFTGMNKD